MSISVETRKTVTFHPTAERMTLSANGDLIIIDTAGRIVAIYAVQMPDSKDAWIRAYQGPPNGAPRDLGKFAIDYPKESGSGSDGSGTPQLPPASAPPVLN